MFCSHDLDRLLQSVKAAAPPNPQLIHYDQDTWPCNCSRLDLFESLIAPDNHETTHSHFKQHRKSQERGEGSLMPPASSMQTEQQPTGCKCTKIDCLKLYCECFARGKSCNEKCVCVCCGNHPANHGGIYHAQRVANYRKPGHFTGVPAYVPARRCTCKKSSCQKNYCECFRAGQQCGHECECLDCRNGKPHRHSFGMDIQRYPITTTA